MVGGRALVLAPLVFAAFFAGGNVALAAAVPSVAVEVFLTAFGGGFSFSLVSLVAPISRSCTTGVTMPLRNMNSCVPIRIADETTM